MPISDPSSHRTKWLLMKCLKLQPTLSCLLTLTQHRHCSREGIRRKSLVVITWLEAIISENNPGLVPWYTHISHLPPSDFICLRNFWSLKVMESRWNRAEMYGSGMYYASCASHCRLFTASVTSLTEYCGPRPLENQLHCIGSVI